MAEPQLRDPFLIEGPAVISFSGGRTSGYMLWRILQAHGGTLPADVVVIFANTGKEMPETLDFVQACSDAWSVPIVWIEYRRKTEQGKSHEIVTYQTASRKGEPYDALIDDRKYLPNPFARFCTVELKIRPMHRYVRSLGWDSWLSCIGIRADEQRRIARVRNRGQSNETVDETPVMPLADAGIGVHAVLEFWRSQSFDLRLPVNQYGNTTHGNCDLCFLKKADHILSMIREAPHRATWWANAERRVTEIGQARATGAMFRMDRPNYASMQTMALNHGEMFDYDEPLADCACTD